MAEPESKLDVKSEPKLRAAIVVYFPMFIATLSLVTSIYNGYLNNRFVTLIQGNIGRVEYMRTCRDIIDAYFQVKLRAGLIRPADVAAAAPSVEQVEAMNAVSKFGSLGTYLANLRNEDIRRDYTELSRALDAAIKQTANGQGDRERRFDATDDAFSKLNDDCIKSAQAAPL